MSKKQQNMNTSKERVDGGDAWKLKTGFWVKSKATARLFTPGHIPNSDIDCVLIDGEWFDRSRTSQSAGWSCRHLIDGTYCKLANELCEYEDCAIKEGQPND